MIRLDLSAAHTKLAVIWIIDTKVLLCSRLNLGIVNFVHLELITFTLHVFKIVFMPKRINKANIHNNIIGISSFWNEQWPSGQDAGFPTQGSGVQNQCMAPRLIQPFILPRSIKWVPLISWNLVVNSKLSP